MDRLPSSRSLRHVVVVIRGLSRAKWSALVRAVLWVPATRTALTLLPWQRLSTVFDRVAVRDVEPDWERARAVVWAVDAVARRVVRRRPCLTQALVARHLLRRLGIDSKLQIGAARDVDGSYQAHAWLEWGEEVVIGGAASVHAYSSFKTIGPTSAQSADATRE